MTPLPEVFVGREQECQRLDELLDQSRNRTAALVLLTGPPGVGKSTLARYVLARAKSQGAKVVGSRYALDSCTDPYGPFLNVLSELAPESAEGLQRWREKFVPVPFPENWDRCEEVHFILQETRESWESQLVEAFILAVRHDPAIVELADIHLATETAWTFLSRLLQAAREEPLLVVSTLRLQDETGYTPDPLPSYAEVIRGLARGGLLRRVRLQPLSTVATDKLIQRYAPSGELRHEFLQHLHAVSRGNPGRLEAEVQRLLRHGALVRAASGWRVVRSRVQICRTTLKSRFERLESVKFEEELDAALGERVPSELRTEIIERILQARHPVAEVLGEHALNSPPGPSSVLEPSARAKLLAALGESRRRSLHQWIARSLESMAQTPGIQDLVVCHYRASHHPGRALPYLQRLAEQCLAGFAFTEARRYYRQLWAILRDTGRVYGPGYLGVDLRLGWLERVHGEAQKALSLAQKVLTSETASQAGVSEMTVLLQQALALRRLDDHEAALAQLRGCQGMAAELPPFLQALVLLEIATAEFALERFEEAKTTLLKALGQAKAVRSEFLQVRILRDLGAVEMALGEPLKAVGYLGQCVALLKRLGDKRRLAHVYFYLGINQTEMADWTAANRSLRRALALSDHLGLHQLKADAYFKRSLVLLELGRFREAREHARAASKLLLKLWESPYTTRNPVEVFLQAAFLRHPSSSVGAHLAETSMQPVRLPATPANPLPELRLDSFRQQLRARLSF